MQGKRPPRAGWALVVEDIALDGSRTERMRASGAIATAATHGAGNTARIAARQTRQVAQQAAAWKGLRSIAQHRRRQRHLILTVHNATTARDLQPPNQGKSPGTGRHTATSPPPPLSGCSS